MGEAVRIYAQLAWRRMRRGHILAGSLTIVLLPAVVAVAAVGGGRWGAGLFHEVLETYLRLLLPLAPMLAASGVVADEVERNTHTYLFARPAPRAAIVLGKCLTTAAALLPSFLLGTVLAFGVAVGLGAAVAPAARAEDVRAATATLAPALMAVALGVPIYTGVAAGVGTLFVRRPLLGGFLYILIIEELFGSIPGALKALSVSFYLRGVAGLLGPSGTGGMFGIWEPRPSPLLAATIALGFGTGWLLLGVWLVRDAEYREAAQ